MQPADQPMTADEKAQIRADVSETFNKMIEDMQTADFEKFEYYNLLNEEFSTVMDGIISVGGENAKDLFKGAFDYIDEYIYLNIPVQEVVVFDFSTSMVLINFDEAYRVTTGDTLKVKGTATYVMELVEDEWKVVQMTGFHQPVE